MFYCDPCARERKWPIREVRSVGKCECCGAYRDCSDTPSKHLPVNIPDSAKTACTECGGKGEVEQVALTAALAVVSMGATAALPRAALRRFKAATSVSWLLPASGSR